MKNLAAPNAPIEGPLVVLIESTSRTLRLKLMGPLRELRHLAVRGKFGGIVTFARLRRRILASLLHDSGPP